MVEQSSLEAITHMPRAIVFAEVARRRSFREAASALGLSASTVSHHVSALEEALGVRLLERTTRSVRMTEPGRALLREVESSLSAWRRGTELARAHAESPRGNLVVSTPPILAEHLVTPAVQELLARYTGVTVDVRVEARVVDLNEAGVDVAIRQGPLPDSGHGARKLVEDEYGIFATPALANAWPVDDPSELHDAPWVHFDIRPPIVKLCTDDGSRHEMRIDVRAQTRSANVYMRLVSSGLGFALIPRPLARLHDPRLVRVLPKWFAGPVSFHALTPSPKVTDRKVIEFLDLLAESFAIL